MEHQYAEPEPTLFSAELMKQLLPANTCFTTLQDILLMPNIASSGAQTLLSFAWLPPHDIKFLNHRWLWTQCRHSQKAPDLGY